MMNLLRLLALLFLGLTVVYALISVYARSVRRERLERDWDEDPPPGAGPAERAAHVAREMRAYGRRLQRRLVLLVYVLPAGLVVAVIYLTNYA